jgi:acetyltransferase-like isoleucine patch superfamily enzyme
VLINDKYLMQKKVELRGPTIKTGASVGANAVIFPDVTVGEGAVIGAGSVVMEDVPPKVISAGVPAKVMKEVPPDWQSLLKAKS